MSQAIQFYLPQETNDSMRDAMYADGKVEDTRTSA
jgi:hypothetical protein